MGCCCAKKQQQVQQEKKKEIDYEAMKKKYGKVVVNYIVQENIQDLNQVLDEGFPCDMPFDIGGQDSTLLILSIAYKKFEVTKFLLEKEQDINIQIGPNKDCALLSAISAGSIEIVQSLVDKKVDKSVKTKNGFTPMDLAQQTLENKERKGDNDGAQKYNKIIQILK